MSGAAPEACRLPAGLHPVQPWALDNAPPSPGDLVGVMSFDPSSDSVEQVEKGVDVVALLTVTDRLPPTTVVGASTGYAVALGSAPKVTAADQAGQSILSPSQPEVMRPTALVLDQLIKGVLPSCVKLDIPGGKAGTFVTVDSLTPSVLPIGAKVLVLATGSYGSAQHPLRIGEMAIVSSENLVQLPYGGGSDLDVRRLSSLPPA